jgi:peroxiredoxin
MSLTPTRQIPLGFKAPNFTLPDTVSGKNIPLDALKSNTATVMMFICNHCPYVIHVIEEIVKLAQEYQPKGISFIAISSNDIVNYPQDSPAMMTQFARENDFPFPYLYDESQEVAKAYQAACTPDFSVFDGELKCVYRGQLDDSRPGNKVPLSGKDLRQALDNLLKGEEINITQIPSVGCNIKWKK